MKLSPIITGLMLAGLIIAGMWVFWWRATGYGDQVIVQDIAALKAIFERIDQECEITGFDYDLNPINFLTVRSFYGNGVGSMNLFKPEKWAGPYLQKNPEFHGHAYQIACTRWGCFIVPGNGVKLGNGQVIGADIVFDKNTNIPVLVQDKTKLLSAYGPLAVSLPAKRLSFSDTAPIEAVLQEHNLA